MFLFFFRNDSNGCDESKMKNPRRKIVERLTKIEMPLPMNFLMELLVM